MSLLEQKIHIGRSRELLAAHVIRLGEETIGLDDALGRVITAPIYCDRDLPPFDRVTMDGIAIRWRKDVSRWTCVGTQYAGQDPLRVMDPSQCVEIMTGAMLPTGADTVIPVEWLVKQGNTFTLNSKEALEKGQWVHLMGSDSRKGDELIAAETRLSGRHLALGASVGKSMVRVTKLPRVAYVSTGDELVNVNVEPGQVEIRRSNDRCVAYECKKLGIQLSENLHLPDDPLLIEMTLRRLLGEVDMIVFSGGVSMGKADYIPSCADACGVELIFHKVRQKPGGPVLYGKHPAGCTLLGMPGNPLSCMVCARFYLRVVLQLMTGYPLGATSLYVQGPLPQDREKTRLLPVRLEFQNEGHPQRVGRLIQPNTSGDMTRVLDSDGMVIIPPIGERVGGECGVFEYLSWEG